MKGFGYLFSEGLKNVWNNRGMSAASIGILVSCLVITGVAVLFCQNVQLLVEQIGDENMVSVYLDLDLPDQQVKKAGEQLKKIENISRVTFYSKEEGIKEFSKQLGDISDEFTGKDNPLPDSYKVTMKDLSLYDYTIKAINKIDGVYKISDRRDTAKTLMEVNNMVATMGFWVVFVLGMISLFIVSNAIKTTMHSRRFEISIMKSVGATNAFVRIPFVIEGMTLGIIAGIISSIIVRFLYDGLLNAVQTSHIINIQVIDFSTVVGYVFAIMVTAGALMGALGATISIGKYLKREGNELLGW
ncbi:MAG: permease-like cell division protein FtsX [Acutalibacteraceae bacterium]|nr:permease-like cell division protein FtsX [Acutalibacteraceae bacterium]